MNWADDSLLITAPDGGDRTTIQLPVGPRMLSVFNSAD